MSPHGYLAGIVDKLEMTGNRLEVLVVLSVLDSDLEEGVIGTLAVGVLGGDSGELLVGGIIGGGDIVREEEGVGDHVPQAHEIVVLDVATSLLVVGDGKDLPIVVGVIVRITGNLLTLAGNTTVIVSEGVFVLVTVKIGLCLLVSNSNAIVVLNIKSIGQHDIVAQGFLELRSHEVVTWARAGEDSKVNLEPEEVEEERQEGKTESASSKVLAKLGQADSTTRALDVEQVPEVNGNGGSDSDEGEKTNVLGGHVAREGEASEDEPLPPLPGERLVSELVELDVEQKTASHGENKGRIQQNQSSLSNVGIVEEDKTSSNQAGWETITRFPHDQVGDGHGEGAKNGGQSSESDIGNLVGDVRVSDVLEVEVAIISN